MTKYKAFGVWTTLECRTQISGCGADRKLSRRLHLVALMGLLLLYLLISLRNLEIVPPLFVDEPWIASHAWKLATTGVFGSDLFAGHGNLENRTYEFMPLYALLQSFLFRWIGLGLIQIRLLSVTAGLIILFLTYGLGQKLWDKQVALLSVFLLLFVRLTGLTRERLTGIHLLDTVRISRYDVLVPIFGLIGLFLFWKAITRSRPIGNRTLILYFVMGIMAALSGLSHIYGIFWVIAYSLLAFWERSGWRAQAALALGFLLPWLAYIYYVWLDFSAWQIQIRIFAAPRVRFNVFSLQWFIQNLVNEPTRYGPGLGPPGLGYLLRPGFWLAIPVLALTTLTLLHQAIREKDLHARIVILPLLVIPSLFALLIQPKQASYIITYVPLAALAAAWWGVKNWRDKSVFVRVILIFVLLAITTEGTSRIIALEATAKNTQPYADFITEVHGHIVENARVLGPHNYWLGLHDLDYRAWFVPLIQLFQSSQPLCAADEIMRDISPDVILIDRRMRVFLENTDDSSQVPEAILDWIARHDFILKEFVESETYGRMEIYVKHVEDS